jgi:hypothetical protein
LPARRDQALLPQCAGDELEEKWAKRREKREARKTKNRLQETVASQSGALDSAHLLIQHLQRRLRRHPR